MIGITTFLSSSLAVLSFGNFPAPTGFLLMENLQFIVTTDFQPILETRAGYNLGRDELGPGSWWRELVSWFVITSRLGSKMAWSGAHTREAMLFSFLD